MTMRLPPVQIGAKAVFIPHENRVDKQQMRRAAIRMGNANDNLHVSMSFNDRIKRVKSEVVNLPHAKYLKLTIIRGVTNNLAKELKSIKPYSITERALALIGYGRKADIHNLKKIYKQCDERIRKFHSEKDSHANDLKSAIRNRPSIT